MIFMIPARQKERKKFVSIYLRSRFFTFFFLLSYVYFLATGFFLEAPNFGSGGKSGGGAGSAVCSSKRAAGGAGARIGALM